MCLKSIFCWRFYCFYVIVFFFFCCCFVFFFFFLTLVSLSGFCFQNKSSMYPPSLPSNYTPPNLLDWALFWFFFLFVFCFFIYSCLLAIRVDLGLMFHTFSNPPPPEQPLPLRRISTHTLSAVFYRGFYYS